jgi:hypothetical protein
MEEDKNTILRGTNIELYVNTFGYCHGYGRSVLNKKEKQNRNNKERKMKLLKISIFTSQYAIMKL